jgi:hypothetical protein
MEEALRGVRAGCRETEVAAIVGMEWVSDLGPENPAFVISPAGKVLGYHRELQETKTGTVGIFSVCPGYEEAR